MSDPHVTAPAAPPVQPVGAARPQRANRRIGLLVRLFFLIACVGIGIWGVQRNPYLEERRLKGMTLSALQQEARRRPDDPLILYYTGQRLDRQGRYADAVPLLERAVRLDPGSARLHAEWTQALLGSGQITPAYAQLQQFAKTFPNSAEAHFLFGKFYFTQGSMKRAGEEMERAAALEPDNGETWAYLSAIREALADPNGTRAAAEQAARLRPDNPDDHLRLAAVYDRANRPDDARRQYEEAVRLAPRLAAAHRDYARWLLAHASVPADQALAEQEARQAVALNAGDAQAQFVLGEVLSRSRDRAAALEPLAQAATLAPDDPAPARALWTLNLDLDRKPDALRWQKAYLARQNDAIAYRKLLEAIEVHPEATEPHAQLARLAAAHGDVGECLRQVAAALRCAPDAPPALLAAGRDLIASGHAAPAIPLARQAIERNRTDPDAHEVLGDALLAADDWHNAAVEYQAAADADPNRMPILKNRLKAYFDRRKARLSAAERAYRQARTLEQTQIGPRHITPRVEALARQAVTLEPANPTYLEYLLHLQVARRYHEAAIQTARRLLAIKPDDSAGHALLAILLLEKAAGPTELAEAETHLRAVSNPDEAATRHYGLGVLALKRHDGATAVRELKEAVRLDPDADMGYYQLAFAERLVGDAPAAEQAMRRHDEMLRVKSEEARLLEGIAHHPQQPEGYRRAIAYFAAHGLTAQADALRASARRRQVAL